MKAKFSGPHEQTRSERGRRGSLTERERRWWRELARREQDSERPNFTKRGYWSATRCPLPCIVFIAPLLAAYEFGLIFSAGATTRAGADAWARQALQAIGFTDNLFPPLLLVIGLLAWQVTDHQNWRFSPWHQVGMALESLVLALGLIGLSRLVDLGLTHVETRKLLEASNGANSSWICYLGAGIYEEAIFRLALIPLLFWGLRLIQAPNVMAGTLAVTTSSLVFALAHHVGIPGESFTWFAFIFRWAAGVYFAWIFLARGFAVAVGTHAAYDVMVGRLGWHW